jgi:hypothetical protein
MLPSWLIERIEKKREKFIQEQLQIEAPRPQPSQEKEKDEDKDRGITIIDLF